MLDLRPAPGVAGELCRIAARLLAGAYAKAALGARPGLILFVQSFGNLANFNPHVHVLAADGGFRADGAFVPLPPIPEVLLNASRTLYQLRYENDSITSFYFG